MLALANTEEAQDMTMAKDIAETLFEKYAGYLWAVNVSGGIAVIKCLNVSSNYGFVLKYADIAGDSGVRKKEVIRAGGEILERASLKRGERVMGSKPQKVEGIEKYNPIVMR